MKNNDYISKNKKISRIAQTFLFLQGKQKKRIASRSLVICMKKKNLYKFILSLSFFMMSMFLRMILKWYEIKYIKQFSYHIDRKFKKNESSTLLNTYLNSSMKQIERNNYSFFFINQCRNHSYISCLIEKWNFLSIKKNIIHKQYSLLNLEFFTHQFNDQWLNDRTTENII